MAEHSPNDLRAMSEHVLYEFEMLVRIPDVLNRGGFGQDHATISNALIESFVVHARGLDRFLFLDPHKDDVAAVDYFPGGDWPVKRGEERPQILIAAHDRAGKEIAHITIGRLKVSEATKSWMTQEIISPLQRVLLTFARTAASELVADDFAARVTELQRNPGLTTGTRRLDPTTVGRVAAVSATVGFQPGAGGAKGGTS